MQTLQLALSHVRKGFGRPVLTDINLCIDNTSYVSILGKSGSGKSTLMNILGLVEDRDDGEFTFNGINIEKGKDYSALRKASIGFIFQSYNLIPTLTCVENIRMPLLYVKEICDRSAEWMDKLDIAHLKDQRVNTLSGGEKQRVAIARALILDPCLILADEPTGNLDEKNGKIIFSILAEEHARGRGIVLITHDAHSAGCAKTILRLEGGELHAG